MVLALALVLLSAILPDSTEGSGTTLTTTPTASIAAVPTPAVGADSATTGTSAPTATLTAAAGTSTATAPPAEAATSSPSPTPGGAAATGLPTSATETPSPSTTPTPTSPSTGTPTPTATATESASPTPTRSGTETPTPSATATPTLSKSAVANDDFDTATAIGSLPFEGEQSVTGATLAPDDPDLGSVSATVWYRFVAPDSGSVRVVTFGSDYDTVLAAFRGSRGSLTLLALNDDQTTFNRQSEVAFDVEAGVTYFLEISEWGGGGAGGQLRLRVEHSTASLPPATNTPESYVPWEPTATATAPAKSSGPAPANDDISSAAVISALPFTSTVDTTGASSATDDPTMGAGAGLNSNTVWYSLTVAAMATVRVHTLGSDYDTVLAVFAGSRGGLVLIASNDDASPGVVQSDLSFTARPGVTYHLEAAQYGSPGGGRLRLEATSSAAPTPTVVGGTAIPSVPLVEASAVLGAVPHDDRYFSQTGFRVDEGPFWDYFQKRGGVRSLGYPTSRTFPLLGFKVQFFQRGILQLKPDGGVTTMNLLDDGLMPYNRINGSSFPLPDRELIDSAPLPIDPDYGAKAMSFVTQHLPDRWEGMDVDFLRAFLSTVTYEDAFPQRDGEPALVPLLNLELWGLPTSRPARDPGNSRFVYQRFQRGILHYDAETGATQGLLLADYLKAIITGERLPPDLEAQARTSRFYRQYDPTRPGHLARPIELPGTNLVGAFDPDD